MVIKLEKFTNSDFESYFKFVSNVEVMKMITAKPIGLEQAKEDFKNLIKKK